MGRLIQIAGSTLLGGVINQGSMGSYISDAARRTLGMGLAELTNGQVQYFSKDRQILKRAAIQSVSQLAYGALRSYPRYLKYFEQKVRDKYLQEQSQTSIANKTGQYFRLIEEQQDVARRKSYADSIVGNIISDYLELSITAEGVYFDSDSGKIESNSKYGLVTFVDLQPQVQVSSRNNIILTNVQGRDYSRKEFVSGGDLEISISGKITSKYPDVYPEAEVSKFLKLMQYKGVVHCDNTILRQFKISRLIVQSFAFSPPDCRNIQSYTLNCVAVEPSEAIELKLADQEKVDKAIKHTQGWIKYVKFGAETVDPASLLKISKLWL
ncbi:hypothetical protein DW228_06100 [Bacteroides fragilis]|uniref:DUF6046 domain-containing protein n=1 Tax=Bacteroides fragilis TaxID=817 RepID=A0A396C1C1_BACFG|nr:DUF6046 domain-containing protein [Bacteroides fragilis]RHH14369.1 hypothetical protein DW228_06100 [Bacteroides fragilis]